MSAEAVKIEVIGVTTDPIDPELDLPPSETGKDDKDGTVEVHLVTDSGAEVVTDLPVAPSEPVSSSGNDAAAGSEKEGIAQEEGVAEGEEPVSSSGNDAAAGSEKEGIAQEEGVAQGEQEEEDKEECGFCLFMKGGPCGEQFSLWQDCVDGSENSGKDIVSECAQMTTLLKVCMEMKPDYYGVLLEAEKAMEAEINAQKEDPGDEGKSRETATGNEDVKVERETVRVVEIEGGQVFADVMVETKRVVEDDQTQGGEQDVENVEVEVEEREETPQRYANQ